MNQKLQEYLGAPINEWLIEYRVHATRRMFNRNIEEKDVLNLLEKGIVVEEYKADYPFPSVLVNGTAHDNRALHAVVGIDEDCLRIYLITVYEPDPAKWSDNFSKRLTL